MWSIVDRPFRKQHCLFVWMLLISRYQMKRSFTILGLYLSFQVCCAVLIPAWYTFVFSILFITSYFSAVWLTKIIRFLIVLVIFAGSVICRSMLLWVIWIEANLHCQDFISWWIHLKANYWYMLERIILSGNGPRHRDSIVFHVMLGATCGYAKVKFIIEVGLLRKQKCVGESSFTRDMLSMKAFSNSFLSISMCWFPKTVMPIEVTQYYMRTR